MGGQISTALHTKLHCSTRQWLINFSTSDNHSNQAFTAAKKRMEWNYLWAWLESTAWLSERRAGTHRSRSCLLWSFSDGQCGWYPKDNACGQALQGWAPQYKRHGNTGVSPAKCHKGWKYLSQKKRLGELGLFSFREETGWGEPCLCVSIFAGECKEDKDRLFSVVPTQRAMGIKWHRGNAILTWRTYLLWEWSLLEQAAQQLSFPGDI